MENRWKSVIFIDLDNTIIEGPFESAVFPIVFREISEKSGLGLAEIRHKVVKENFERQNDPDTPAVLAMDWDDIFRTVSKQLNVKLEANVLEIVKAHAGPPFSKVLQNADKILRKLANPHRAIVAATKGLNKYQVPILDALNLTPLFTALLTPDSSNALKQSIVYYGRWPQLTHLQISVGDHYEDDVLAPKSFGFKVIWKPIKQDSELTTMSPFARPTMYDYSDGQLVRPNAIIMSIQELPEVVEQLEESHFRDM